MHCAKFLIGFYGLLLNQYYLAAFFLIAFLLVESGRTAKSDLKLEPLPSRILLSFFFGFLSAAVLFIEVLTESYIAWVLLGLLTSLFVFLYRALSQAIHNNIIALSLMVLSVEFLFYLLSLPLSFTVFLPIENRLISKAIGMVGVQWLFGLIFFVIASLKVFSETSGRNKLLLALMAFWLFELGGSLLFPAYNEKTSIVGSNSVSIVLIEPDIYNTGLNPQSMGDAELAVYTQSIVEQLPDDADLIIFPESYPPGLGLLNYPETINILYEYAAGLRKHVLISTKIIDHQNTLKSVAFDISTLDSYQSKMYPLWYFETNVTPNRGVRVFTLKDLRYISLICSDSAVLKVYQSLHRNSVDFYTIQSSDVLLNEYPMLSLLHSKISMGLAHMFGRPSLRAAHKVGSGLLMPLKSFERSNTEGDPQIIEITMSILSATVLFPELLSSLSWLYFLFPIAMVAFLLPRAVKAEPKLEV